MKVNDILPYLKDSTKVKFKITELDKGVICEVCSSLINAFKDYDIYAIYPNSVTGLTIVLDDIED